MKCIDIFVNNDCLSTFPQAVPLVHRVSMDVATLTLPTPNFTHVESRSSDNNP
jgi:hypothetical protein